MKYILSSAITTLLLLHSFCNLSASSPYSFTDNSDIIAEAEAEDGILSGVTLQTAQSGYSGSGYVANFSGENDRVSISVTIPKKGFYKIKIRYGGFWGQKSQDLLINGEAASTIPFPQTSTFETIDAGTYQFEQGDNTISIVKNWGYMAVDKIEIYLPEEISFNIDHKLVDRNADENTQKLFDFLKTQFGERMISGQTRSNFDELVTLAGNTPMLKVGDLSCYTEGYPYLWKNGGHTLGATDDGTVAALIDWVNSKNGKGLVSLQWHWHSPTGGEASQNNFYTNNTDFDVREAVKPGTEEYNLIIRDIDAIAVQLKRFESANVPVLWRPLHEAGGGWFWWGAHGSEPCLKLYEIIYDRLMSHHQIHNLIWVWSTPEEDWYPGNHMVDIIGFDSYPGVNNYSSQKYWFDQLHSITEGKKLIAMTENGPIPDPDECFEYGAPWLYFMSWDNLVEDQNETSHLQSVFSHSSVITIESDNALWRSSLYPDDWQPGFKDATGRFYHDFSYAGYHQGEDSIPFITKNLVDVTQAPYNADNTGGNDVTTILQQALDDVGSAGGGVVYLPAGTYLIREASSTANANAALHMKYDSVILRGAGPDQTFIFHDQDNLRTKDIVHIRKAWANWSTKLGTESKISSDLMDPTKIIPVQSIAGFSKGDLIVVRNDMTTAFATEHKMDGIWDNTYLSGVEFLRRIDSIDLVNKFLIIDIPTRYYLKTRDNARVYHAGTHIMECGIENLSFGNRYNPKTGWGEEDYTTVGTGAYDVHGSHVMHFKYAQDCWVKNVHTYKPDVNLEDIHVLSNCLVMNMSRNITVDSCDFQKSQYEGGGGNGYMYTFGSNDCLVKNSRANDSRHNFDFKYPHCCGNVILNCKGENSKYSSDFHMYLSMANLFDGFTSNKDYLECAFRPYGGTVIHGYPSTQSVFYNTHGEAYHSNKDYVVDSRQFGWGYVTGTSGPASGVKTSPVSGTMSGYAFDTSPTDFVEGEGNGENLRPVSLYMDQLERRMNNPTPAISYYKVKIVVTDKISGNLLENVEVILNDSTKSTNSNGEVTFSNMIERIAFSASLEDYYPYNKTQRFIYTDTSFIIELDPFQFDVDFQVLDTANLQPFRGVYITFDGKTDATNDDGLVDFTVVSGTYDYLIDKLSYQNKEGSLTIDSDTSFTFYLTRTHGFIKIRLKNGAIPVNKAWVAIGNDSIESNNLGLSLFSDMPVNTNYSYTVRKADYKLMSGDLFLKNDTTINIAMVIDTLDYIALQQFNGKIWPNPVKDFLYVEMPQISNEISYSLYNLKGVLIRKEKSNSPHFTIDMHELESGMYLLKVLNENKLSSTSILKK